MSAKSGAIICKFVIVYDNFILGKGPGAACDFGFAILEKYMGAGKVRSVKDGMLID